VVKDRSKGDIKESHNDIDFFPLLSLGLSNEVDRPSS
jgi:hypothetical protein